MPYEVHFYSSGAIEEGWDRVEPEGEPAQRDRRLRPRRPPRRARWSSSPAYLFHPLGVEPDDLGTVALPAQAPSARPACCWRSAECSSASAAPRSTPASPPPTTSPSSSAGSGAATAGREKAPRFTASWLIFLFARRADRAERASTRSRSPSTRSSSPVVAAAAHLPAGPADRRRSLLHGRARERPHRDHARLGLLRGDPRPRGRRDPAAAGRPTEGADEGKARSTSSTGCSTSRSSTPMAGAAAASTTSSCAGNPPRVTALLVGEGLYPRRLPRRLRGCARRVRARSAGARTPCASPGRRSTSRLGRAPAQEGRGARARGRATTRSVGWSGGCRGTEPEPFALQRADRAAGRAISPAAALGRVFEAKAHWERDGTVVLDELIVGRNGLWRRLRGVGDDDRGIPWEAVVEPWRRTRRRAGRSGFPRMSPGSSGQWAIAAGCWPSTSTTTSPERRPGSSWPAARVPQRDDEEFGRAAGPDLHRNRSRPGDLGR